MSSTAQPPKPRVWCRVKRAAPSVLLPGGPDLSRCRAREITSPVGGSTRRVPRNREQGRPRELSSFTTTTTQPSSNIWFSRRPIRKWRQSLSTRIEPFSAAPIPASTSSPSPACEPISKYSKRPSGVVHSRVTLLTGTVVNPGSWTKLAAVRGSGGQRSTVGPGYQSGILNRNAKFRGSNHPRVGRRPRAEVIPINQI